MNTYTIHRMLLRSKTKLSHSIIAASRKEALRASQEIVRAVYKCESVVIGYSKHLFPDATKMLEP